MTWDQISKIREIISGLIYYSGLYSILSMIFRKKGVYIVFYHHLSNRDEKFEKQIRYLRDRFEIISMKDARDILTGRNGIDKRGNGIDKKYLVITLDDGYRDNYTEGYEVFERYNIKPTIYLTANNIENQTYLWPDLIEKIVFSSRACDIELKLFNSRRRFKLTTTYQKSMLSRKLTEYLKKGDESFKRQFISYLSKALDVKVNKKYGLMLSWSEVGKLADIGADIGAHTLNHAILAREKCESARNEIYGSKALIEERTGKSAAYFAYPNGKKSDFNGFVKGEVSKHFETAVTTIPGVNVQGGDLYELKRFGMCCDMSPAHMKVKFLYADIMQSFSDLSSFINRVLKQRPGNNGNGRRHVWRL